MDWPALIRRIHDSGHAAVIVVTGGGSEAISRLLCVPGASRSVLEAVVPYSAAALADWLGAAPAQACAPATARAMSMAAYLRARALAPEHDARQLAGIACTASLASDRPKRGDHRAHIGVQTATMTATLSATFDRATHTRASEETAVADILLQALAAAVASAESNWNLAASGPERIEFDREVASPELTALLLGSRSIVSLGQSQRADRGAGPDSIPAGRAIFPGAFNPPHAGHLQMAAIAEQRLQRPLAWELSIANVDKPLVDFISVRDRVSALREQDGAREVVLTRAPTFVEKSALFPAAVFVVGADTITRIAEPRYYQGDADARDRAVALIAAAGCRFLVFGREVQGAFRTLSELELPPALRALGDEVTAAEFREDVSSTALRARDTT